MWQSTDLCASYNHPAFMQLRMNSNEFHSWFHSRKPSMDDVGNPTSVNARVEASLCKGDGQFGNPGIPMATEVVAFRTSCGIVSARLSANNGRARASRASKSDGCLALLKRTSYIKQGRRLDRDTSNVADTSMINASDKTEPAASLPTCLHIAAISSTSVFAQISNAVPAKRNWKHQGFMETEKEKIDKSDDRLGDQSRCGNTRMPKHPCLLVPYKGTIRLLSSDNTLLAWIDRALHPLVCHLAD
ncbi:hypothetical protein EAG_11473 [Camponotus floridanus]|uniref:Uncharacterized protein n=1 Tax=Camponotus floridanus TaxID=104421 RepID=E2A9Q3_CAMFO|nr:hypothetical protein EAG_11473 [Camponotus floridanus]